MLNFLRKIIPARSPLRLGYHKFCAILATVWFRFPGHHLTVIAVTGTSGKSTTVELIGQILQKSGYSTGSLSSIGFRIGDKKYDNASLRTSLRPWQTQKWLRKMVQAECSFAVIEVSSHAIDQNRHWGIFTDTAVLTNVFDNEHLDYHQTFEDYLATKLKLFETLNLQYRKPKVPKQAILNADSEYLENFEDISCDRIWTYSYQNHSHYRAQDIELDQEGIAFTLKIPNQTSHIRVPILGLHNVQNVLAAIAAVSAQKIPLEKITHALEKFEGIPARLQKIEEGQKCTVLLDYTYKPSALKSVLKTLKDITKGRVIVVWGGAGGRSESNWIESAQVLHLYADEIVLTTDDPYDTDPRYIVSVVREHIPREENSRSFFEIADRYEAIRYALLTAQKDDTVLVAGRGHEKTQTIKTHKIPFEDEKICREILQKFYQDEK